jgi:hypothetical protein
MGGAAMNLLAIVLTYNEAHHITECLAALAFADARLVVDSYSTDATVERARASGAEVMQRAFDDYAGQRNAALHAAAVRGAAWVLFVDADERVTPLLAQEIRTAIANAPETIAGYAVPRHNLIFNRLTRGAGWYPDHQLRLLRVGRAQYDPARRVHEVVLLQGERAALREPLIHHNYRDIEQFHAKQRRYVAYDAQILREQGIRARWYTPYTQAIRHFGWRFFMLRGYIDGLHGLRLSAWMAWYESRKYERLRQQRRSRSNGD